MVSLHIAQYVAAAVATTVHTAGQYCTGVPGYADGFCLHDRVTTLIGGQLAITLDIGAYWGG